MMDLSIIVPVYNMASDGKLEYCINSLVDQTLENLEVIAVDDASTDESLEVLKKLEKEHPGRLKVVASPENRKQGGARNLGLKEAQGRFIGFMDADDWVMKDTYEKMLRLADETGADVVGTDMCLVYEHTMIPTERVANNDMAQTGIMDHEKRKLFLLKPGPLGTKIYARDIFFAKEFRFPENMAYEDNATSSEIAMRVKHFEYLPETNVFYYQHGESTTHHITLKKCEDRMQAMRIMLNYAKENGALEEFRDVIEYQFSILFYRNTLFGYLQSDLKKDVAFIRRLGKEMVESFPDFQKNPYFEKEVNDYEKKLIRLHLRSTIWFLFIYKLKRISKKIKDKRKA